MYAHYFEGKGRKELILSTSPDLRGYPEKAETSVVSIMRVDGKRSARAIAKAHSAQPWNF